MEPPTEARLTAIPDGFVQRGDRLVIPSSGQVITDQNVRDMRLESQRGGDEDSD